MSSDFINTMNTIEKGKITRKPKLLVVTSRYPFPVIGGDRLRIFNMCRVLAKDFSVSLLCITDTKPKDESPQYSEAKYFNSIELHYLPKWKSLLKTLIGISSNRPMQVNYYLDSGFATRVKKASSGQDVCLFHLVRTAEYADQCSEDSLKVLEMTDAISRNYSTMDRSKGFFSFRRLLFKYENLKLKKYETKVINNFKITTLVSDSDISYLCNEMEPANEDLLKVSNGIQLEKYRFRESWKNNLVIGFVGNITSLQNFDACFYFASEILPKLQNHGNYKFKIIGRIGNREKERLDSFANTLITGEIESVERELRDVSIGVCPVRVSAGVQNKILEYLAVGIPAISTKKCADSLQLDENKNVLIADTPDEYLDCFHKLSIDKPLAKNLRMNGRQFVESHHDWHKNVTLLSNRIKDCIALTK